MSHDSRFFRLVKHPLRARRVRVLQTHRITPHVVRIVVGGPELEGFASLAPEDHVKLFFPEPGEQEIALPSVGPLGLVFASPTTRSRARDYTPHSYDAEQRCFSVDFYLHSAGGLASSWAAAARVGDELGVLGPRGSYVTEQSFGQYLLLGDETALPELEGRLARLEPGAQARVVLVVDDLVERRELTSAAALDVSWLARSARTQSELVAAIDGHEPRSGFSWLAGEAGEVRAAFDHLVRVRGVEPARVHASGHWKRGVRNHDHHERITTLEASAE